MAGALNEQGDREFSRSMSEFLNRAKNMVSHDQNGLSVVRDEGDSDAVSMLVRQFGLFCWGSRKHTGAWTPYALH